MAYAYVAAGSHGLAILDITNPEQPRIDQVFEAGGCINDLHALAISKGIDRDRAVDESGNQIAVFDGRLRARARARRIARTNG
jgi:hypothetical protein